MTRPQNALAIDFAKFPGTSHHRQSPRTGAKERVNEPNRLQTCCEKGQLGRCVGDFHPKTKGDKLVQASTGRVIVVKQIGPQGKRRTASCCVWISDNLSERADVHRLKDREKGIAREVTIRCRPFPIIESDWSEKSDNHARS